MHDESKRLEFKGYILDPFQQQALQFIEEGRSVVVSAPTGVGKTLIADYLIEKAIRENKRLIYTAPIKALSNQKYRQFKASLGEERVGILTGDVVINKEAPVLMMTTEVYRNMVLTDPDRAAHVHYLIFDEIHYIDSDRGTAWEESLIFAPEHVKFLGLSATIGNQQEFVRWLSEVRNEPVALVVEERRVVPLSHRYFNLGTGITSLAQIAKAEKQAKLKPTDHRHLVQALRRHYLPALIFVFSRRQCVEKARDLLRESTFLSGDESAQVASRLDYYRERYDLDGHAAFSLLSRMLYKGIGFHHAGLLPILKDLVEELFEQRLIKVLYCTETFAVGVNYPVRSVCFVETRKYDGVSVRSLSSQEYMQMAGRAGRRGIDEKGFVFTLVPNPENADFIDYASLPIEPIGSQYRLSCNSILNLMRRGEEEQVAVAFERSFSHFLSGLSRQHVVKQYETLQSEAESLASTLCEQAEHQSCPLQFRRLQSKLSGLEREVQRYGRHYLRRRCNELRSELAKISMVSCHSRQISSCRKARKELGKISVQLSDLSQALSHIPTSEDWLRQYHLIKQRLEHLSYIDGNDILPRGELASEINFQEILITEFVFAGMLDELAVEEICALLIGIDYSGRYSDFTTRERVPPLRKYFRIAEELKHDPILGATILYTAQVAPLGYHWAKGIAFSDLMELSTIEEGDVVSMLRRTVDVLRQLRKALSQQAFWRSKLDDCLAAIERDVVRVEL